MEDECVFVEDSFGSVLICDPLIDTTTVAPAGGGGVGCGGG